MSILKRIGAVMDRSWPNDSSLYFQDEVTEISLPDFASSLSCRTYLRMCNLEHTIENRSNAEFISPTGKVPVLRMGDVLLSGFSDIVDYIELKGVGLMSGLDENSAAEMNAYIAMVQSDLTGAENYIAWIDKKVASQVTKKRYGLAYPWPLNKVIPYMKQSEVRKILGALGWLELNEQQVCDRVRRCCEALSVKLGSKDYFFGDRVTALDAVVFGHLFALVTTILPNMSLSTLIKDYDNLQAFLRRINDTYYSGEATASPRHYSAAAPTQLNSI